MRPKLTLIIGVGVAMLATILAAVYIQQTIETQKDSMRKQAEAFKEKAREEARLNQVPVIVAKVNITKGSVVDAGSLDIAIISKQEVMPRVATSLDKVVGLVAVMNINKGEQILLDKLQTSKVAYGAETLAMATPVGKRAFTVPVDSVLGGMLRPGDCVDISVTMGLPVGVEKGKQITQTSVVPLFQNVLVLAVGYELAMVDKTTAPQGRYKKDGQAAAPAPASTITLALSPRDANLLAFVQDQQAKLRYNLRSPSDVNIENMQTASWDTLFAYLMPEQTETKTKAEAGNYIEIFRGSNKEKILLSK